MARTKRRPSAQPPQRRLHTSLASPLALYGGHSRLHLVALTIAASGGTAHAQTSAPHTEPGATQLPTVTVSADQEQTGTAEDGYLVKKITGVGLWGARDLQDTPYSMSVIPEELIENANAKDMDQIFRMNPTTQETARIASDSTDGAWVTIRGFQVNNPVVNGMPYASRVGGTPMMQDIERVEIINGATGFLYGGGRVGGAVNYVTKKPTLHDLRTVSVGSYGGSTYFGHVDLGGQIDRNSVFGYRFNALYQDGETSRKEKKKIGAASLVLDLKPSDDFYTDLRISYKDTENPGPTIFWGGNRGEPIDYSGAGIRRNQSYTPEWQKHQLTSKKIENSVKWNISDVFTLRTGVFHEQVDRSGGDARIRYVNGIVQRNSWYGNPSKGENSKLGAAAYLDAKFATAGVRHTLTVGYSSSTEKTKSSQGGSSFLIPADTTPDGFRNFPMPAGWGSAVQAPTPNNKTQFQNVLIGDDIQFNEHWSALVGGNYASITTKNLRTNVVGYDQSAFTPTLSLIYKPFSSLSTYATYIESLEQGATIPDDPEYANPGGVLAPYISKQYEIGAKYKLNERTLLNLAVFRIEKADTFDTEDLSIPAGTPGRITRTRDGLQVHQGVEIGITGKVTDNLTLIAGGTVMDLSLKKNNTPALDGKKPTGAASRMAKIYAEYRIPGVEGLSVSGGAYYTGKKYDDQANTVVVPAYTLFDAGIRYAAKLGRYPTTFNFTVQNIADKVYWSNTRALGDPRTFAFTVKTTF
ncbi:TonB-dependent siderophore receptor [Pseudorhodoferax sp.]|uniref:TonB-dependent siderophore receptor n=1 Tax=Pseudorhodoferax sp. TaxID=1993553 RepID=UPI0039E3EBD2